MRIASPMGHRRARFEMIPLIDIMFFLLASFMMVSITMIRVEALKMDLPTATAASPGQKPDMIQLEVDPVGNAIVVEGQERRSTPLPALFTYLTNRHQANPRVPAYIKGHPGAKHGQVIAVLDTCRHAGIQKVSFDLTPVSPAP